MKYMTGNEIRKAYLDFFESKKHLKLHSFSLVPENDPSLLLIGAGMAPLKPYFTGKLVPPSYRVTTRNVFVRVTSIMSVVRHAIILFLKCSAIFPSVIISRRKLLPGRGSF